MSKPRAHHPQPPEADYPDWTEQVREMQQSFGRAASRSFLQFEEFLEHAGSPLSHPFRAADLARSQWFLWAGASIMAMDRFTRAAPADAFASVPLPPRALGLGNVALELIWDTRRCASADGGFRGSWAARTGSCNIGAGPDGCWTRRRSLGEP